MARRLHKVVQGTSGRNWIRAGDTVQVMVGNDAGTRDNPKRGKVLRVLPQTSQVLVEGVNKTFKHIRKSQEHPRGGRVEKETPIHISKVALVCPTCNAPSRRKIKVAEEGKKIRICSHDGAEIPLPS